jgi:WhiB family redox-sensing transcriptional regulator
MGDPAGAGGKGTKARWRADAHMGMSTVRLGRWVARAACRGSDTRLFFPETRSTKAVEAAKSICSRCEVVRPCRAWAMAHPGERGIWGGLTEAERRAARRADSGKVA